MKDHNTLLSTNKVLLQKLLKEQKNPKKTIEPVIQEVMKPYVMELNQIRKIYDDVKSQALEVNQNLKKIGKQNKLGLVEDDNKHNKQEFQGVFNGYVGAQNRLRKKLDEADNMKQFYKDKFKELEDFQSDLFMKKLRKMNSELADLEERANKGQGELEKRIEGINKKYDLMLPASYVDMIEKNLVKIDYVQTRNNLKDKLGGDLDYKDLQLEIDGMMEEMRQTKEDFEHDIKETEIIIPELGDNYAEEYIKSINETPSILEDLKTRIQQFKESLPAYHTQSQAENIISEKNAKRGKNKPPPGDADMNELYWYRHKDDPKHQSQYKPGVSAPRAIKGVRKLPIRGSRNKPDYLRGILTKPMACKPDIKYRKLQPDSNDYTTMFDVPEEHDLVDIKNRMGQTDYDVWKAENGHKAGNKNLIDPRSLGDRTTKIRFTHKHDMQTNTGESFHPYKGTKQGPNMLVQNQVNLPSNDQGTEPPSNSQGMGTDDFLRTFGNGGKDKSLLSNGMNTDMVRNFIRTQTSGENTQNDEDLNKFKQMTMYSDDIAAQTKNQMNQGSTDLDDPFYQDALKTGIDSNLSSIRNYFASKTPPKPFSNYDAPTIPEHPFTDKNGTMKNDTGPSGMNLPQQPQQQTTSSQNPTLNDQTIDDLSKNIINMLSKAIEKATPKVQVIERPATSVVREQPQQQKNNYVRPQTSNGKNPASKIDLKSFYNNYHPVETTYPMYENEFQSAEEDSMEESIADDLNKYLEILNEDIKGKQKPSTTQPLDRSEGEVDFGGFTGDVPIGGNVTGDFDFSRKPEKANIEPGEKLIGPNGKDYSKKEYELEEGEFVTSGNIEGLGAGVFDVV